MALATTILEPKCPKQIRPRADRRPGCQHRVSRRVRGQVPIGENRVVYPELPGDRRTEPPPAQERGKRKRGGVLFVLSEDSAQLTSKSLVWSKSGSCGVIGKKEALSRKRLKEHTLKHTCRKKLGALRSLAAQTENSTPWLSNVHQLSRQLACMTTVDSTIHLKVQNQASSKLHARTRVPKGWQLTNIPAKMTLASQTCHTTSALFPYQRLLRLMAPFRVSCHAFPVPTDWTNTLFLSFEHARRQRAPVTTAPHAKALLHQKGVESSVIDRCGPWELLLLGCMGGMC